MIRAAILFFVIGLLAMFFGLYGVAGISMEIGRLLLFVFIGLAILSFLISLGSGGRPSRPTA